MTRPQLDRDNNGKLVYAWKPNADVITPSRWATLEKKSVVHDGDGDGDGEYLFIAGITDDRVTPQSGDLSWNEYRKSWIFIFGDGQNKRTSKKLFYREITATFRQAFRSYIGALI